MNFEMWTLINRVQELSVQIGWLRRENAQAKVVIEQMLLSADCSWEESGSGHDWACSCKAARGFLAASSSGEGPLDVEMVKAQ